MAYITDLLRFFMRRGRLSEQQYRETHTQANVSINLLKSDWFEEVLAALSSKTGISEPEVRELWRNDCYFTSALQYVHLGNPENIINANDTHDEPEASSPTARSMARQ
jgi:hypothetical protein